MIKYIGMLVVTMVTSMYFFPFEFTFLPGANTKMILAGIGLVWLFVNLTRKSQEGGLNRDLFNLSLWAMCVSLIAFVSITFNNTNEYVYATYFISMWVWLGGAYTATRLMRVLHGHIDASLICHYLIAVCVGQCLIAYCMGRFPSLKSFVDGFQGSTGFMGKVDGRLYGIGASLDVGGMRFASVLVILGYLCVNTRSANWWKRIGYALSFIIIVIVGNMIGRTTTVGAGVVFVYWLYVCVYGKKSQKTEIKQMSLTFLILMLCCFPIITYYYHASSYVHDNMRFAFEGFFSLVENGHWEVHSNNMLKNMYVFPDNGHTWLIGDGYFDDPVAADPYYLGYLWKGFYQGTDVGYLRFIFYAGIFFTFSFVVYMFFVARACVSRLKGYTLMFVALLILNYIVWFKVSSDLFLVFAIFLCIPPEEQEEVDKIDGENIASLAKI